MSCRSIMPNQRDPKTTTTSFSLPKHILEFAKAKAEERGQSVSEYLRYLLLRHWDEQNAKLTKKQKNK